MRTVEGWLPGGSWRIHVAQAPLTPVYLQLAGTIGDLPHCLS